MGSATSKAAQGSSSPGAKTIIHEVIKRHEKIVAKEEKVAEGENRLTRKEQLWGELEKAKKEADVFILAKKAEDAKNLAKAAEEAVTEIVSTARKRSDLPAEDSLLIKELAEKPAKTAAEAAEAAQKAADEIKEVVKKIEEIKAEACEKKWKELEAETQGALLNRKHRLTEAQLYANEAKKSAEKAQAEASTLGKAAFTDTEKPLTETTIPIPVPATKKTAGSDSSSSPHLASSKKTKGKGRPTTFLEKERERLLSRASKPVSSASRISSDSYEETKEEGRSTFDSERTRLLLEVQESAKTQKSITDVGDNASGISSAPSEEEKVITTNVVGLEIIYLCDKYLNRLCTTDIGLPSIENIEKTAVKRNASLYFYPDTGEISTQCPYEQGSAARKFITVKVPQAQLAVCTTDKQKLGLMKAYLTYDYKCKVNASNPYSGIYFRDNVAPVLKTRRDDTWGWGWRFLKSVLTVFTLGLPALYEYAGNNTLGLWKSRGAVTVRKLEERISTEKLLRPEN